MNSHLYNLLEALSSGHKLDLDLSMIPMVEINANGIHDIEHDIMLTYSEMTDFEIMDYYYKLLHGALVSEIKYRTHIEQMDEPYDVFGEYKENCFKFVQELGNLLDAQPQILAESGVDLDILRQLITTQHAKFNIKHDFLEGPPNYVKSISLTEHSAPILFETLRDFIIERYCNEEYENPNWIVHNIHKIIEHVQKDIKLNTVSDIQVTDICKELNLFFVEYKLYLKYETFGKTLSKRITQTNTLKTFNLEDIFFQQVIIADTDFSIYPPKAVIKALLNANDVELNLKNYDCLKATLATYIENESPPVYTAKAICASSVFSSNILKDFSSYNAVCKSIILSELEEKQLTELLSLSLEPIDMRIVSELRSLHSLDFQLKRNDIYNLYTSDIPAVTLSECDLVF